MFYLVLPSDYKTKDSDAEVVSMSQVGKNCVSYRNLNCNQENSKEGSDYLTTVEDTEDEKEASTYLRSGYKRSVFQKSFASDKPLKQEIIYSLRVLLDGNEKFIWLQAASEMNRLADASAIFIVGSTLAATRKIFKLPGPKKNVTALRYAEWARIVDNNKSVSTTNFDPFDDTYSIRSFSGDEMDVANYDSTKLVKIRPFYAYKNRRMTLKDLDYEMKQPSEHWEDFRKESVGYREEPMIGSLHVEVLSCHGLPKLDRFSLTDACCYVVCGPFAFATDVLDGAIHPCWPSKSRRACIFPIFYAYQKLYVGVFDDDGAREQDDFAGRVVVDISNLRPNSSYDVFLPLRLYQNTYIKDPRGVIRLRIRLEWENERKALLSYLKLPKKVDPLGNALVLNCADLKAFRNVVMTVQGKDVPGRYKQMVQKGLQREMKLYKLCLQNGIKEQTKDIILWVHPFTSGCIFSAWMHCVYTNSLAYVPVYLLIWMNVVLYNNYIFFGKSEQYNCGFTPLTVSELLKSFLFGGPGTNYMRPIHVVSQNAANKSMKVNEGIALEPEARLKKPLEYMQRHSTARLDDDHLEFPFSEKGRYPKKTLAEACCDANATVDDDDNNDTDGVNSSGVSSMLRIGKKKGVKVSLRRDYDEDEDDELNEFELMVSSSISRRDEIPSTPDDERNEQPERCLGGKDTETTNEESSVSESNTHEDTTPDNPKVWKRSHDPLPEQDATIRVKARKTLKQELIHNKDLLHKMTLRLFDDRIFVTDGNGQPGEDLALNAAIGVNKHKNPVVAKMAEFLAPVLEILKVGLSLFRSGFNLFTWRDPYLTFLFQAGSLVLTCILIVFPWRWFFFLAGLGCVGPQNIFVRIMLERSTKKREDRSTPQNISKKKDKKNRNFFKSTTGPGRIDQTSEISNSFKFHNHLLTTGGIDLRTEKKKSSSVLYRAVIPNSPLISRRFYDWPPNPSLSHVAIYE
eukprot:CCRYP_017541-RA/>CCRYP_017541-RA protein AED:0.05 eAED:0.05 QI:693/1/1/1/1/0.87/8/165/965